MTKISKTFQANIIEQNWYHKWLQEGHFKADNNRTKKTFSLIMPPPNITGSLHMGHALDNVCQDIIVRYKRMKGFRTLWIPGIDHAGIATQAVVEKNIFETENKTKHEIGRDEFLKRIWEWKELNGNRIIEQLKRLGLSCDWDYLSFTMDRTPCQAVKKAFVSLYNQGLIYQADYIIHWDPILGSAISDAEVEYKTYDGHFYTIRYPIKGEHDFLEVATTRPETLYADTAIAVNPNSKKWANFIGKKAVVPLCNREVPIIADEYVDEQVGTGCLKVTPGHDFNDFEIGRRHKLALINLLNKDATFNENAPFVKGLSVLQAREKTEQLLREHNALIAKEKHSHQVGHGQRSGGIVEPMISKQWFLDVSKMSQKALSLVENGTIKFFPKGWENTYFSWMKNPKPWCLSRQLWWGHQIPVYYHKQTGRILVTEQEVDSQQYRQDEDVLDTWFSSSLWPLSTLGWPDEEAMNHKRFADFYPNQILVTGFDIIFFWAARMIMMTEAFTNQPPFHHIYIHAIIRDKQGRKMSKSLGNGIDPIDVIDKFGADAVRFTLASGAGHNKTLNLDPERIEGYRNFVNKLWNAFRFLYPFIQKSQDSFDAQKINIIEKWLIHKANILTKNVSQNLENYRFDLASINLYEFTYDIFCSWGIELSKPILYKASEEEKNIRVGVLKSVFIKMLKCLHPIIPYVSEEIYSYLNQDKLLVSSPFPSFQEDRLFKKEESIVDEIRDVISEIRHLKAKAGISPTQKVSCFIFAENQDISQFITQYLSLIKESANLTDIELFKNDKLPQKTLSASTHNCQVFISLEGALDIEKFIIKTKKDIEKLEDEIQRVNKKLSNQQFLHKAKPDIVQKVKDKRDHLESKIKTLTSDLKHLTLV